MDERPSDHNAPGMVPHDPPASCPACGWWASGDSGISMCHCD